MTHFLTCRAWIAVIGALIVVLLQAGCASLEGGSSKKADHEMATFRRDLSQVGDWSVANRKSLQEIYSKLNALESKLNGVEKAISERASRPQPQAAVASKVAAEPRKTKRAPKKAPAKRLAKKPAPKATVVAAKPSVHSEYESAHRAYKNQRHDEALALFKNFYKRYPNHDLADNAQYWIGEIYYDIQDYPNAILAFKEVVTDHADENKAPDALLKIGYSYIALDDPANARIFLKRVIRNYPFSESEAKARAKLKEIKNLQ